MQSPFTREMQMHAHNVKRLADAAERIAAALESINREKELERKVKNLF